MFENKTKQHIVTKLCIQRITSVLWSKLVHSL